MANSAVSILSVSLNEEMLRANSKGDKSTADGSEQVSKDNGDDSSTPLGRHARKHSLGSNVEHEFSFQSAPVDEDKENYRFDPFDPPPAETGSDGRVSRQELTEPDMDETLVPRSEDENAVEKENSAPTTEAAGESEGSTKKHKKKGLAWLLQLS